MDTALIPILIYDEMGNVISSFDDTGGPNNNIIYKRTDIAYDAANRPFSTTVRQFSFNDPNAEKGGRITNYTAYRFDDQPAFVLDTYNQKTNYNYDIDYPGRLLEQSSKP